MTEFQKSIATDQDYFELADQVYGDVLQKGTEIKR